MATVRSVVLIAALGVLGVSVQPQSSDAWLEPYREIAPRLIKESQSSDFAWRRLAELTDTFGHRLSGSDSLERAIDWAVAAMKTDGLENVRKEPVMVPRWVRGRESLELLAPIHESLPMLGLGNSTGTPATGIEADVVVVRDFDDLSARGPAVKGKIVLFNVPFTNYGATVLYRSSGPSRAAALGAVAALVRSVGPNGLRTPHTGATQYAAGTPQIFSAFSGANCFTNSQYSLNSVRRVRMNSSSTRLSSTIAAPIELKRTTLVPACN